MIVPAWAVECLNKANVLAPFILTSGDDNFTCTKGEFTDLDTLGTFDGVNNFDSLTFTNQDGDLTLSSSIIYQEGYDLLHLNKLSEGNIFNISGVSSIDMGALSVRIVVSSLKQ